VRQVDGSARTERDEQFHEFVVERRPHLLRTATLLTAGDAHLAEDLVQATLTKLYLAWPAFRRADNPDGYLRRVLVNALTDERRRLWRRREHPVAELPAVLVPAPGPSDGAEYPGPSGAEASGGPAADAVRQALRELPPRIRAAVVFRYFYDLDVAATAEALGCSVGTVKSQTARALDHLRAALEQPAISLGQGVTP
jgi:RNA polymerase sigma-70 factor (sigma-E family)